MGRSSKRRTSSKRPFKRMRKIPRGPAIRQRATQMGADKFFVKCQRLELQDLAALPANQTTYFGSLAFHELKNIWKFHRYASLYSYFRVHKMKITFAATGHVLTAATCVDSDSDANPTDMAHILMNRTSRVHQIQQDGVHSRTFNLQEIAKFRDYISCEGANTLLQDVAYKAAIRYGFPHLHHKAGQTINVTCEFIVEFCGFRDIISTDNVNNPSMAAAIGPEDNPVYFDHTTNP
jgi:hypothetical protein